MRGASGAAAACLKAIAATAAAANNHAGRAEKTDLRTEGKSDHSTEAETAVDTTHHRGRMVRGSLRTDRPCLGPGENKNRVLFYAFCFVLFVFITLCFILCFMFYLT